MTDLNFKTGYSDCTSCGGVGVVRFEMDGPYVGCPECDDRDRHFEELYQEVYVDVRDSLSISEI